MKLRSKCKKGKKRKLIASEVCRNEENVGKVRKGTERGKRTDKEEKKSLKEGRKTRAHCLFS